METEIFYKVIEGLNVYSVKQGEGSRWYVVAKSKEQVLGLALNRGGIPIPEDDVKLVSSATIIHGESDDYNKAVAFSDKLEILLDEVNN